MSPLLLILIPLLSRGGGGVCPRASAFRVATISTLITLAVSLIIAQISGIGTTTALDWSPSWLGCHQSVHPLTCMLMRPPCGWCCFRRS